jgi:hypothetical protein
MQQKVQPTDQQIFQKTELYDDAPTDGPKNEFPSGVYFPPGLIHLGSHLDWKTENCILSP